MVEVLEGQARLVQVVDHVVGGEWVGMLRVGKVREDHCLLTLIWLVLEVINVALVIGRILRLYVHAASVLLLVDYGNFGLFVLVIAEDRGR